MTVSTIVALVLIALGAVALYKTIRIVPQANSDIVERFGRYHRTLSAGFNMVVPMIDQVRSRVDLREQIISFPPQPVITQDNLEVGIDTVIYYQVTHPKDATYEVASYLSAIEQLTVTTLRNVIGGMDLESSLTSREAINRELRQVLDEATGRWGIRVNRVELKAIDPPDSIKDAMEKQMRADRDKRANILTAEGQKRSAVLTAEGEKEAAILRAQGQAQAAVVTAQADAKAQAERARGQAEAISTVFSAIHEGNPSQGLLAYQYLQTLPKIAEGNANKVWIVPSEMGKALEGLGGFFGAVKANGAAPATGPAGAVGMPGPIGTPGPAGVPETPGSIGPVGAAGLSPGDVPPAPPAPEPSESPG
jgi:regulator of protease activity HflC (stomatin/prohibitin superfamily)